MEKNPTKDPAPNIACAPSPYALRTTTLNNGVEILAPTLNSRVVAHQRRTLDLGAHHDAGAVDQAEHRDVERVGLGPVIN